MKKHVTKKNDDNSIRVKIFKNPKAVAALTAVVALILWSLAGAAGLLQKFDYRIYDLLLGAAHNPEARNEIVMVEADNESLEEIGEWPWPRNVVADALIRMKELGAKLAVFDIEYLSPSSTMVDENALNDAIAEFDGNLPDFNKILIDNDGMFARAIQFFGNTWLTVNTMNLNIKYTDEEIEYVKNRFLFDATDEKGLIKAGIRKSLIENETAGYGEGFGARKIDWNSSAALEKYQTGFSPALHIFMKHARGAGFTNVIVDGDGTRRRIELLNEKDGKYLGQLSTAPLLSIIKPEEIVRNGRWLNFENCSLDGESEEKTTIKIPLDDSGRMLINWKHEKFRDCFRHESFLFLNNLDEVEKNIISLIGSLNGFLPSLNNLNVEGRIFDPLNSAAVCSSLASDYADIIEFKNYLLSKCEGFDVDGNAIGGGISDDEYAEYFDARKKFFADTAAFAGDSSLEEIGNRLLAVKDLLGDDQYGEICKDVESLFDSLKHETDYYNSLFEEKSKSYNNAFCILGNTASSTTDLGTNPFERAYANVGTHANIYNTIMNQEFIFPVSWWWGNLVAGIFIFVIVFFAAGKKSSLQNVMLIFMVTAVVAVPVLLMVFWSIYVPAMGPVLTAFSVYLFITLYRFTSSEKDKKFLQTTFGAYVAPAVVDQIVKDPEIARLGGKTDELTALFSDVKAFSAFTETVNNAYGESKGAEQLVSILNEYLGVLSDAIMDNDGTIDKYVGDEIVSFFGAPVHDDNNAFKACVAGIRMLQAEKKFNEDNKDKLPVNPSTGKPFYLHSRVGLNTGNMVVGNMGTEKKLNYTIMGNNVNLASRLEGTNKVYGSWIMCAQSTWEKADSGENKGKLIARKFDYVRVVNVKKPVQIYNILGLREEMSDEQIKAAEIFNQGIEWYLKGCETPDQPKNPADFKKAGELFVHSYKLYPEDESSKIFAQRCADYLKEGIPERWDGIYEMKTK